MMVSFKKVSWVLDADLKGFFDNIDHACLLRQIRHRICDERVLKLITSWLTAGVMDGHTRYKSEIGTPQGAVISPLLANIYLHYALDKWVVEWRLHEARGEVYIIRYADDFVMGFQYQDDVKSFKRALETRLGDFKLSLHSGKTQLIEFGRFAKSNREQRGVGKPKSFDFLGFTHICSIRRDNGKFKLMRESIKKKLRDKIKQIGNTLMQYRHKPLWELGSWLRKVLTGYYNYFAIPGNHTSLQMMRTEAARAWIKAMRRRSQKGRNFNWFKMQRWINRFSPHTRVRHPYPNQRFHL
jgi:group II intron reverse transcriptase/maturase